MNSSPLPRSRLGLRCQLAREPIKLPTPTAMAVLRLPRAERRARLAELCRHNTEALVVSLNLPRAEMVPAGSHPCADSASFICAISNTFRHALN